MPLPKAAVLVLRDRSLDSVIEQIMPVQNGISPRRHPSRIGLPDGIPLRGSAVRNSTGQAFNPDEIVPLLGNFIGQAGQAERTEMQIKCASLFMPVEGNYPQHHDLAVP